MEGDNRCGHCGHSVPAGYTVCSGCGAHYRRSMKALIWGALLLLIVPGISLDIIKRSHGSDILTSIIGCLILMAVPALLLRHGLKKKWYRFNA